MERVFTFFKPELVKGTIKHIVTDEGVKSYMNDELYNEVVFSAGAAGSREYETTIEALRAQCFIEEK